MTKPINEMVVLITGGAQGIGLHTALNLAKQGYKVVVTSRSIDRPELLALKKQYLNTVFLKKLDVANDNQNSITALINEVTHTIGPIDILINNAGIGIVGAAESLTEEQIKLIFDTNVMGVVKVTNAVLSSMRERNTGMIVTISSIVGPLPDMRQCFYSGSKAMIEHYTSQLKNDLRENGYDGIVVANIHPGPVVTNFENAAPVGKRFDGQKNPYPNMQSDVAKWRELMKQGRPVSETVETTARVIISKNPPFWNPTEKRVAENFDAVYHDPSGERFSRGPLFNSSENTMPDEKKSSMNLMAKL